MKPQPVEINGVTHYYLSQDDGDAEAIVIAFSFFAAVFLVGFLIYLACGWISSRRVNR